MQKKAQRWMAHNELKTDTPLAAKQMDEAAARMDARRAARQSKGCICEFL